MSATSSPSSSPRRRNQARDGAEKVVVDYEELPAIIDPAKAQDPSSPQVHPEAPGNLIFHWGLGNEDETKAALAKAKHITKLDIVNNRLIPFAIEPRAAIGAYDPAESHFTLYNTTQNPHVARLVLSAFVGIAPENKLRVIAPDVGGGFGSKIFIYAEETICLWASKRVGGRPVKWTADRTESFLSDCHGRDHVTTAEMAFDADNRIIGLKVHTIANLGAYMSTFSSSVPTYLYAHAALGPVRHPGDLCRGRRGLHQHHAGRRRARRRAARGGLRRRAADRDGGARTRRRSGRTPPEELHHDRSRTRRR